MPIPLNELFVSGERERSAQWNIEVFQRAYVASGGPFPRVIERLRAGYSVLVYLHGSCMRSAAEYARRFSNCGEWIEHGLLAKGTATMTQIWQAHAGLLEPLSTFFSGSGAAAPPQTIFHNLDLLSDGRNGLDGNTDAKTALLYLAECTRNGVVLGLSDLASGALPDRVRQHFDEEVRLEEIDIARFGYLVPRKLGDALQRDQQLLDSASFLLASRLRWTEPGRAVRIMSRVAERHSKPQGILEAVTALTRGAEYEDAAKLRAGSPQVPAGFETRTVDALTRLVIEPYQNWLLLGGDDPRQRMRRLPAGVILHGPPGTGKTRLARWMAAQIGMPVRQVSAADLKRSDWGLTERLVHDLFASARRTAPCMIVLDDADDLLPDRDRAEGGVASAERGVVNAFLQEIEGFGGRLDGVLLVLTTNRRDSLDRAARSRLPLEFRVPYPLTKVQVREIVVGISADFASAENPFLVESGFDKLADYFFGVMDLRALPPGVDAGNPDERRELDDGLFSPREIASAMRMVFAAGAPDEDHVNAMKSYYFQRKKR